MDQLDRSTFIERFKECYKSRDLIQSLYYNELFEITPIIGQTEDLSWFTADYFDNFYDHVDEVYYYRCDDDDELEWSCLVKLDNGYYFFMNASTDCYTGFSYSGECNMFASTDIDRLLKFGLTDAERDAVKKMQS